MKDVLHFYPLRKNRSVRFDFGGLTVLVASSGDLVSFYTTVGLWGYPFKGHAEALISFCDGFIALLAVAKEFAIRQG